MSSGKLDQSLDEILSTQRKTAGRRSTRRPAGKATPAAPVGGIKKNIKPARNAGKPTPAKASGLVGESKIMVSNLVSNSLTCHLSHLAKKLTLFSRKMFPRHRSRYVTDEAIRLAEKSVDVFHPVTPSWTFIAFAFIIGGSDAGLLRA